MMNRVLIGTLAAVIVILVGAYWYTSMSARNQISVGNQGLGARRAAPGSLGLGTYAYVCDEHVTFTLTISDGAASIALRPKDNPAYPQATLLKPIPTPTGKFGKWFTDNDKTLLIGRGASVTLQNKGSSAINCALAANPDAPRWNWDY